MSNYTKTTNFTAKDSLTSGNPAKIVKGAEHDAEYNAIAVAVNSKSNTASPTFTGTVEIPALTLNSVLVTSTAAELNILDGVTATAAELNILDGVTATAAEINALDGITATVTELNYTDGVTSPIQAQIDLKAPITNAALVTPNLGTPSAGVLTNATGLPVSTGISGLGSGVASFLATPSSANLLAAVTNETGTGALVFATSPTLVTPALGTPTSATLTNATGLPISTGVSGLATGVASFLATPSSANLRTALTDETGTGSAVFATAPTITSAVLVTPTISGLTLDSINVTNSNISGSTITTSDITADTISDDRGTLQSQFSPLAKAIRVALLASASVRAPQVLDDADIDMGTNNFTVVVRKRFTTTRPAANEILYHKHDGTTGIIVTLLTTGIVRLTLNATTFDSTVALTSASNVEPVIIIPVTRSSASAAGSVIFVVDGVQIGASVAISVGAPASVDNSSNLYLLGTSTTTTEGAYYDGAIYNRALSVAECLAYCLRGPDVADIGGNQTITTSWTWANFGGGSGYETFTTSGSDITSAINSSGLGIASAAYTLTNRKAYRVRLNITVNSGSVAITSAATTDLSTGSQTIATITSANDGDIYFDFTSLIAGTRIGFYSSGSSNFSVTGFQMSQIGITGHWPAFNAQANTGQLADRSGNKNHMLLPASGATILGDRRPDVQLTWENTWAATSELQYFPGVNQACYPTNFYIEGIILTPSATTTAGFTIGNGSNASYYATASGPLTEGVPVFVPLTNRYPDGTNLKLTITPMATTTCTLATTVFGRLLGGF